MPKRSPRHTLIPNANNVRFLTRVLESVAKGVRDPKALAEVLDCEVRTVHYYTQAGDWLGLIETEESRDPHLTRLGLEFVYAGRQRPKVYAEAIWSTPFVIDLMSGQDALPSADLIAEFIETTVPEMAPTTARRRASAVRSLIQPAIKYRKKSLKSSKQMSFQFAPAYDPGGTVTPLVDLRAGTDESPDVYRVVSRPSGSWRTRHRTPPSRSRCQRSQRLRNRLLHRDGRPTRRCSTSRRPTGRDLGCSLETGCGGHRCWSRPLRSSLPSLLELSAKSGGRGSQRSHPLLGSSRSLLRLGSPRFLGESIRPAQLSQDLDRILLGRPIEAFPLAEDPGDAPPLLEGAFLDLLQSDSLVLTFPPSLQLLLQGTKHINAKLEQSNRTKNGVRLPEATDHRVLVHGGLFPPGLPLPRTVADTVTLRLMAVTHVPFIAMSTALLLLDRRGNLPISIHRNASGPIVKHQSQTLGSLSEIFESMAEARGWMVSRQTRAEPNALLGDLLVGLGIGDRLAQRLVLDETFFVRLKEEPEDQEVANKLVFLEDLLQRHIEEMIAE